MNILLISASYPPLKGGVATHVTNLAHGLLRFSHTKVSVISSSEKYDYEPMGKRGRKQVWKLQINMIPNFYGRHSPLSDITNHILNKWHLIKADIVHVHDFDSLLIGAMLKSAFNIPLVFTLHRAPSPWRTAKYKEDPKDCFLELFRKYDIIDKLIVPSNSSKIVLLAQNFNENKIRIINHGLEINFLTSHSANRNVLKSIQFSNSKKLFLCPSRADEHHHVEIFIQAASEIKKNNQKEKFIFVLADEPIGIYSNLLDNAKNLGLEVGKDMFFKSFSFMEMITIYKKSTAVIIPSVRESFCQSVIEAFVLKSPVIASNSTALSEIISHNKNGLLFSTSSYKDLVYQMQRIIDDPTLQNSLTNIAYEDAIRNYNSEDMVTKYMSLYEEIIKKRAALNGSSP